MINTVNLETRLDGGYPVRNMLAKSNPHTVVPPLVADPVTETSELAKGQTENNGDFYEKSPAADRSFAEEKKPVRPDPMEEVVEKAMTRMVATRQAAERFLLGVMAAVQGNIKEQEGHLVDTLA